MNLGVGLAITIPRPIRGAGGGGESPFSYDTPTLHVNALPMSCVFGDFANIGAIETFGAAQGDVYFENSGCTLSSAVLFNGKSMLYNEDGAGAFYMDTELASPPQRLAARAAFWLPAGSPAFTNQYMGIAAGLNVDYETYARVLYMGGASPKRWHLEVQDGLGSGDGSEATQASIEGRFLYVNGYFDNDGIAAARTRVWDGATGIIDSAAAMGVQASAGWGLSSFEFIGSARLYSGLIEFIPCTLADDPYNHGV